MLMALHAEAARAIVAAVAAAKGGNGVINGIRRHPMLHPRLRCSVRRLHPSWDINRRSTGLYFFGCFRAEKRAKHRSSKLAAEALACEATAAFVTAPQPRRG